MLADDLLSGAAAAAAFTGLPVRAIYHLTEKGQIPVIRKGRRLFYKRSELKLSFAGDAIAEKSIEAKA